MQLPLIIQEIKGGNGMQKKALSLLLALLMLLGVSGTCFGAALDMPGVTIAVNDIKGETMEVAIKVSGHGDSMFKSVGAVVQYDSSKLTPIRWSTNAAIGLKDVGTARDGWSSATAVESVSPDIVSGKPAMAFTSGGKGYLYLGAETAVAQNFKEDTQVVTVRFGYANGADFEGAKDSVQFVQDDGAAFYSPVKGQMIYQTEDPMNGAYKFYYLRPLTENADGNITTETPGDGDVIPSEPSKDVSTSDTAISAGTGTADPDDFVSLTFYDWDGTLLGTRIVAKDTGSLIDPNTAENRGNYVNESGEAVYTDAELAAMGVAPIVPQGNRLSGAQDQTGTVVEAVNKAGYTYAGWVDQNTGLSSPAGLPASSVVATIDAADLIPLTGIKENKVVKAAYDETSSLVENLPAMYSISYSPFESGNGGLQTTFTITRTERSRRVAEGKLVLVLQLRPNSRGVTRLEVPLGNSDLETFTLTMPSNASSMYQASNAISYSLYDESGNVRCPSKNIPRNVIVK